MADKIIPEKVGACITCGCAVTIKTNPNVNCASCRALRHAQRSRAGMERQRRKRGVERVKGALCDCATCGVLFTMSERKQVRCKPCAHKHMIHLTIIQNARRDKRIRQATPAWADFAAIETMYKTAKTMERLTGEKWHVDHYYPLRGKRVCGLHVAGNLRLLQASVNLKKHNQHPEE